MSGTLQGVGLEMLDRCNAGTAGTVGGGGRGPIAKNARRRQDSKRGQRWSCTNVAESERCSLTVWDSSFRGQDRKARKINKQQWSSSLIRRVVVKTEYPCLEGRSLTLLIYRKECRGSGKDR